MSTDWAKIKSPQIIVGGHMVENLLRRCCVFLEADRPTRQARRQWLKAFGTKMFFIELGPPWENAHMESFNN